MNNQIWSTGNDFFPKVCNTSEAWSIKKCLCNRKLGFGLKVQVISWSWPLGSSVWVCRCVKSTSMTPTCYRSIKMIFLVPHFHSLPLLHLQVGAQPVGVTWGQLTLSTTIATSVQDGKENKFLPKVFGIEFKFEKKAVEGWIDAFLHLNSANLESSKTIGIKSRGKVSREICDEWYSIEGHWNRRQVAWFSLTTFR